MGSAGVGTWIALISCPLFALIVLIVLFRDPGKGKDAERGRPKQAKAAPKAPGLPPPTVPPLPQAPLAIAPKPAAGKPGFVPLQSAPPRFPQMAPVKPAPGFTPMGPVQQVPPGFTPTPSAQPAPPPAQPAIARAKPPKAFTKPSKKAIELGAEPDCVQLQVAAQRAASAAGAAVLSARAAAKQAAQAAGELARLTAARDNAQKALDAVKVAITATKAGLAVTPDRPAAGDDPAQREVARAALEAYRRGDISVEEMQSVWKRVGGWDEQREESDKELLRLRGEETKARKVLEAAEADIIPAQRAAQHTEAIAYARGQEATTADQAARSAYAVAEDCRKKTLRDGAR